jgi:hypothetical protein
MIILQHKEDKGGQIGSKDTYIKDKWQHIVNGTCI